MTLNATPGKGGYSATYAAAENIASWPAWANSDGNAAATIVYRSDPDTGVWDGQVLGFTWGATDCPSYGNSVIDKLCMDLWYMQRLDQSENFVTVMREFELPAGLAPKSLARPGSDPILALDEHLGASAAP